MNNRMQRSVQIAPAGDNKPTDVPSIAGTSQITVPETREQTSQEADEASEVKRWSERGVELSREYSARTEADRKIVAGFRELRDKPKAVKRAFKEALTIEKWDATRFRKVGEDDFLYEPATVQVFPDLTISQQYELAKATLDVKQSIREYFRTHPEDKPSKMRLRELRVAWKTKEKPAAGNSPKQKHEAAGTTKPDLPMAEIRLISKKPFEDMEESDRAKVLSWFDNAPKCVQVIKHFEQG